MWAASTAAGLATAGASLALGATWSAAALTLASTLGICLWFERDATRRVDEARRAGRKRFERALAGGGHVILDWEIASDRLRSIDESAGRLGYQRGEVGRTQADWNRLIGPEDLEAVMEARRRHLEGRSSFYEHEYRVRARDGSWHWMHERGLIVQRGSDGSPRRLLGTQTDVTQRRQVEQALRESQARLALALQVGQIETWQWNLRTDRFEDTASGLRMLGYWPGEIARTQSAWNRLVHPDDLEAYLHCDEAHQRGETPWFEIEYRIRAKDGSWRWFHERGQIVERDDTGQPVRMIGIQADVTDRREADAQRSALLHRLETITRHAPGVVFTYHRGTDGAARVDYASERALEVIGVTGQAIMENIGALRARVAEADLKKVVDAFTRSAVDLSPWHCEFPLRPVDGRQRWILGQATPQRAPDGSTHWHGYLHDVTELRELDLARQARQGAEAASRAKSEFLSRMSHEFRTPLNAVLGFSQLLEASATLDREHRQRVSIIREAGEHLLSMINELLDLTRIESGPLALNLVAVPLGALVQECTAMLRLQAEQRGIALQVGPIGDGAAVQADRTRLKQVLLNLLSNAIKYNRRDGAVRVAVAREGERWRLDVEDTGDGIEADQMDGLFQPFNRLGRERGDVEGTGIGLAVTRGLVERMGGRIGVRSVPREGSTFSVSLHAATAPDAGPDLDVDLDAEGRSAIDPPREAPALARRP